MSESQEWRAKCLLEMQVSEFHTLTSQKALGAALVPTAGRPPGLLLLQHVGEALLPMRLLSYSSRATGRTSLVPSGLSEWRPSPSSPSGDRKCYPAGRRSVGVSLPLPLPALPGSLAVSGPCLPNGCTLSDFPLSSAGREQSK